MEDSYHTHIIRIGNSKGIRIPKKFLPRLGDKVVIYPSDDGLVLHPDKGESVPPREKWDALFAKAKAKGEKPEKDIFEGMENETDQTEWTWE